MIILLVIVVLVTRLNRELPSHLTVKQMENIVKVLYFDILKIKMACKTDYSGIPLHKYILFLFLQKYLEQLENSLDWWLSLNTEFGCIICWVRHLLKNHSNLKIFFLMCSKSFICIIWFILTSLWHKRRTSKMLFQFSNWRIWEKEIEPLAYSYKVVQKWE